MYAAVSDQLNQSSQNSAGLSTAYALFIFKELVETRINERNELHVAPIKK